MTNVFLKYFPGIPVYISIGNHEGVPQDAMVLQDFESKIRKNSLRHLTRCLNTTNEVLSGSIRSWSTCGRTGLAMRGPKPIFNS